VCVCVCVCVNGEFHASAALHPGREPSYPLNSSLCVSQSRCGRFGEERNLFFFFARNGTTVPRSPSSQLNHYAEALPKTASMWLESLQSCHALLTEIFMFFLESVRLNTWKVGTRHHEINQNLQISGIFMFSVKHDTMTLGQSQ